LDVVSPFQGGQQGVNPSLDPLFENPRRIMYIPLIHKRLCPGVGRMDLEQERI